MKRIVFDPTPLVLLRPDAEKPINSVRLGNAWWWDERIWATIVSALIHVWIFLFLWNLDVHYSAGAKAGISEVRTILIFEDAKIATNVTSVPPVDPVLSGKSGDIKAEIEGATVRSDEIPDAAPNRIGELHLEGGTDTASTKPLDLSLPDGVVLREEVSAQRKPWERRKVLEVESTRFAGEWAPDGDAAADLAWRSKSAAFLMSVFGGGAKPCTAYERRQRHPRCVPDNARQEDIE